MKIFITGATGFIGTQLVKKLSLTEHKLYCLVRKMNSSREQIKKSGANLVIGDISDKTSMLNGMQGCDYKRSLFLSAKSRGICTDKKDDAFKVETIFKSTKIFLRHCVLLIKFLF